MKQPGAVIIPVGMKPLPERHEIEVAQILADHYHCVVEFLQPTGGYKAKTPDIVMNAVMWEIKSPTGNSRRLMIQYQFKGLRQSRNLVIDGRRTGLDDALIQKQITLEMTRHRVTRMLFIAKSGKVVEF